MNHQQRSPSHAKPRELDGKPRELDAKHRELDGKTVSSRKGIPNRDYAHCTIDVSRCPQCKSTARSKYYRKTVLQASGTHRDQPYSLIVLRYCNCTACGLPRRDVTHEMP